MASIKRTVRFASVVVCLALGLSACSSVTPKRVKPGKEELNQPGLRYYETRPFLLVRKPYPIASTPYLVHGVLSTDGKSFLVIDAPSALNLPARTVLSLKQPLRAPSEPGESDELPSGQGDSDTPDTPTAPAEEKPKPANSACEKGNQSTKEEKSATENKSEGKKEVECKDTSGQRLAFSSISLETDLTATALIPVNDLFSIIYLPDYDREFFIESKARWGASRLHITRGPGGALIAYNSEVDNSAVVKPLMDAWSALVSAATKAALIKIEPTALAQGDLDDPTRTAALAPQGVPVTIRIHEVKYAVPGAYPFIKPDEVGKPIWTASDESKKRALVPSHPYQIPYDYFTVLVAEQLLDPPGTSGILATVTVGQQKPSSPNDNADQEPEIDCLGEHQRPPADYQASSANIMLQGNTELAGIKITSTKATLKDPPGCAAEMELQFTGDASKADQVEAFFESRFSGTEFNATQAP